MGKIMGERPEFYDGSSGDIIEQYVPPRAPEPYARPQPPAWSPETTAWLDQQLARRRGQETQDQFDRRMDLARQYQREGASWDDAMQRAECYADPAVPVRGRPDDDDGGEAARKTERDQALLDLTKLIEEGGYSWEDARRIARAELAELRGEEQSVAGLARERLAVEKTKNR
jgi:hypothetical protein